MFLVVITYCGIFHYHVVVLEVDRAVIRLYVGEMVLSMALSIPSGQFNMMCMLDWIYIYIYIYVCVYTLSL